VGTTALPSNEGFGLGAGRTGVSWREIGPPRDMGVCDHATGTDAAGSTAVARNEYAIRALHEPVALHRCEST